MQRIKLPKHLATAVIFADGHKPFHDVRAWNLILKFIAKWRPTYVVSLGDDADCYHWSSFTKSRYEHPAYLRRWDAETERAAVWAEWDRVRAASPRSKRIYIAGNHEERVIKNMRSKSPETELEGDDFVGVFQVAKWWHYIVPKWKEGIKLGKLRLTHGHTASKYAVVRMLEQWGTNVVFGHTHKRREWSHRNRDGVEYGSWNVPCHQRLDPGYAKYPDWTHGFAFAKFLPNGTFNLQIIPLVGYRFLFGDKGYRG